MIKHTKPIIFFDVETTGLEITKHEIIELAAQKIYPDGKIEKYYSLFRPIGEMTSEAQEIHNITKESLINEKTFKDKSTELYEFFNDCDLGGYNVLRFDIPMLVEEFHRAGIHFNPLRNNILDVFKILNEMEPRNLGVMYKYYTGKEMLNAHSAEADISATVEIFIEQIKKYNLPDNIEEIQKEIISKRKDGFKQVDFGGYFLYKDNKFYYGSGKHKGKEITKENVSYIDWMLSADFSYSLKHVSQMIKKRIV